MPMHFGFRRGARNRLYWEKQELSSTTLWENARKQGLGFDRSSISGGMQ